MCDNLIGLDMSAFDSALRTCRTFRCMPFPALDCHHTGRRWMRALRSREERCLKYILTRENNSRRVAGIEEGEPVRYALNVAQKRFRPPTAMANQISCIALFAERKDPTTPVKCRYLTAAGGFCQLASCLRRGQHGILSNTLDEKLQAAAYAADHHRV
jgi:hypothetical protein